VPLTKIAGGDCLAKSAPAYVDNTTERTIRSCRPPGASTLAWTANRRATASDRGVLDRRMLRLLFPRLVLVAACASAMASATCADADLVPGPDGSLTLVEEGCNGLCGSIGSLRGGMSPPVAMSEPGDWAGSQQLAVDRAGDVLAVWTAGRTYGPCATGSIAGPPLPRSEEFCLPVPRGVWYAWRRHGGPFSEPRQLAAPASEQGEPLVAMDRGGDAAVGYEDDGSVLLRRSAPNKPFGPVIRVASGTGLTYLGMDDRGELLLVTSRGVGLIQARLARPGRALGAAQRIGHRGTGGFCCAAPVVAIGPRGDALIAWQEGEAPKEHRVQAVYRPAGGRFGRTQLLATFAAHEEDAATPRQAVVDQHRAGGARDDRARWPGPLGGEGQ
jgi:hypothetical protein